MKSLLITLILLTSSQILFAQELVDTPTSKGEFLIEVGSSPFAGDIFKGNNTGISFISSDDVQLWSVGFDAGYFIIDDLAIKGGLGYFDLDGDYSISYKIGFKYYAASMIPLSLDVTGATQEDQEFAGIEFDNPDPLWLGFQAGYAFFIKDNISFEPSLRYNLSINSDFSEEDIFELRFGFVIFL